MRLDAQFSVLLVSCFSCTPQIGSVTSDSGDQAKTTIESPIAIPEPSPTASESPLPVISTSPTPEISSSPLAPASLSLGGMQLNDSCQLQVVGTVGLQTGESFVSATGQSSLSGNVQADQNGITVTLSNINPSNNSVSGNIAWNVTTTRGVAQITKNLQIGSAPLTNMSRPVRPAKLLASGSAARGSELAERTGGCNANCSGGVRASLSGVWRHFCVVNQDTTSSCWGRNDFGALGTGDKIHANLPVLVGASGTPLTGVKTLTTGPLNTCALMLNGSVKCWGNNQYGQIGDSSTTERLIPTTVRNTDNTGDLTGAVAVFAQVRGACAILNDGSAQCWGWAYRGSNWNGTRTTPAAITGLGVGNVVDIAVGYSHTCALLSTGNVKCWGENNNGQLGNGNNTNSYMTGTGPQDVASLTDVIDIEAGNYFTCALKSDGTVHCWGVASALGDGSGSSRNVPGMVPTLNDIVSIAASSMDTCAIKSDGTASCWGSSQGASPTLRSGLSASVLVAAPSETGECYLLSDGKIKCRGENNYGQLGNGVTAVDTTRTVEYSEVQLVEEIQRLQCTQATIVE